MRSVLVGITLGLACPAWAGDPASGFEWVAHPVVLPEGHVGRLTLDLHVPDGIDAVEYDVDVHADAASGITVGLLEDGRGRWARDPSATGPTGPVSVHLPVSAPAVAPGLHKVFLDARVRTCTGSACADGRVARVPVILHVVPPPR